jgi:hypothetical protein
MKEKLKTKLRRNMRIRTLSLLTVMSAVSLSAIAAAPTVSTEAKKAADMINADAPMQKMLAELKDKSGDSILKWKSSELHLRPDQKCAVSRN